MEMTFTHQTLRSICSDTYPKILELLRECGISSHSEMLAAKYFTDSVTTKELVGKDYKTGGYINKLSRGFDAIRTEFRQRTGGSLRFDMEMGKYVSPDFEYYGVTPKDAIPKTGFDLTTISRDLSDTIKNSGITSLSAPAQTTLALGVAGLVGYAGYKAYEKMQQDPEMKAKIEKVKEMAFGIASKPAGTALDKIANLSTDNFINQAVNRVTETIKL